MVHTLKEQDLGYEAITDTKPKKFVLWLFVVASTIMFGGFTSFYIVFAASKGKGHGLVLPEAFMYSTLILIGSSVCLFFASKALKSGNKGMQQLFLWATAALALTFGYLQVDAWSALFRTGATLVNNNAAISLIYIVSGMHLLHILGGLGFIFSSLAGSYMNLSAARAKYRMELASIFWHFIDILWIYLYVFLLLNS